jgi:PleD family two-component response regulator
VLDQRQRQERSAIVLVSDETDPTLPDRALRFGAQDVIAHRALGREALGNRLRLAVKPINTACSTNASYGTSKREKLANKTSCAAAQTACSSWTDAVWWCSPTRPQKR